MTGRGLILAAPASGSGKTLITAGLARHFRRRGLRVATAKAGPDFIDPSFHATATGRPCLNLDIWGMRSETLTGLVSELEAISDIVLCEGVMGLFDGTGPHAEEASTADLARATGWPVVLIVDARGQGASVAALAKGFAWHEQNLPLVGVIFNRVSSPRHAKLLADAIARHLPALACLGALPSDPTLTLPSRHLGLVPADEAGGTEAVIDRCSAQIAAALNVEKLFQLSRPSVFASAARAAPLPVLGQRIAIARDHAFCFAYPAVLEGWRCQDAELTFFSPLANEPPEPEADSVYLPGGYPELWAQQLECSEGFAGGLRRAAADGKPVYGECGGYMVLGEALVDATGCSRRMVGLLPLVTSFAERRLQLGYRGLTMLHNTPLGPGGTYFRGHEFHYATMVRQGAGDALFQATDPAESSLNCEGLVRGSVFGSFIHLIDRSEAL